MALIDLINPYAYVMLLRRWLYRRGVLRSVHPGLPVISVGNLSMGGTGKSPVVLMIARYLSEQRGRRVAIVSRGYRRKSKGLVLVSDGSSILATVEDSGDEAQMFAELLPRAIVIVDEDRVRGARQAKRLCAEIVLLDDGYQHLRIDRDLNVLLVDVNRPLSSVIPFGRFREPISAARAADVVLFTHAEDTPKLRLVWDLLKPKLRQNPIAATVHAIPSELQSLHGAQRMELSELRGMRVMALSSIASPHHFRTMLEASGAEVIARSLGDHADYSPTLVQAIVRDAERSGVQMIVTTAKDAVKSRAYFARIANTLPVFVLSQRIEFLSGERSFYTAIDRLL